MGKSAWITITVTLFVALVGALMSMEGVGRVVGLVLLIAAIVFAIFQVRRRVATEEKKQDYERRGLGPRVARLIEWIEKVLEKNRESYEADTAADKIDKLCKPRADDTRFDALRKDSCEWPPEGTNLGPHSFLGTALRHLRKLSEETGEGE